MWITVLLGVTFLGFQAYEYMHAYSELNLKLSSGAYGSTFFMLTGFHGFHVFVGMLMLLFITIRIDEAATSRRSATSASKARPGTGTSSTSSGSACTSSSTGSDERRRARVQRRRSVPERDAARVDPAESPGERGCTTNSSHRDADPHRERAHHVAALEARRRGRRAS